MLIGINILTHNDIKMLIRQTKIIKAIFPSLFSLLDNFNPSSAL